VQVKVLRDFTQAGERVRLGRTIYSGADRSATVMQLNVSAAAAAAAAAASATGQEFVTATSAVAGGGGTLDIAVLAEPAIITETVGASAGGDGGSVAAPSYSPYFACFVAPVAYCLGDKHALWRLWKELG
jgi:acyl dehydratase